MKSLFIALLIALPAIVFAQPNFHKGYVLKSNGDTLKGFINYREWAYSPEIVEFKANKNSNEVQEFNPNTIKGFQVTGFETYASYVGLISMNKNIFPDIPSNLDTARQPGAIFLKRLATGDRITLYLNNEVGKNRFFIAEKNDIPVELKYYEYYGASRSDEVFDNLFRGQLLLLIYKYKNGDTRFISDLEQVKFNEADLKSAVDRINNINPSKKANKASYGNRTSIFRLFAGLGATNTTTSYNYLASTTGSDVNGGVGFNYNYLTLHSSTLSPKINLGLDIFTNPNVQQFIFRAELSYWYANASFSENINNVNGSVNITSFSFTQHNISFIPQLLYNVYNTDKLKVYLDAGASINFSSYANNSNVAIPVKSLWAYFPFQAGFVLNKQTEVYFTYTTSGNYLNATNISVSSQSVSVGIKRLF
jgi:hypothetical protein